MAWVIPRGPANCTLLAALNEGVQLGNCIATAAMNSGPGRVPKDSSWRAGGPAMTRISSNRSFSFVLFRRLVAGATEDQNARADNDRDIGHIEDPGSHGADADVHEIDHVPD